jgi:hypothetical protein
MGLEELQELADLAGIGYKDLNEKELRARLRFEAR